MRGKDVIEALSKPLKIEEIEFRIQSISESGYATILAYKNARTDMKRLDEVCGLDWQKDYKLIDGKLFCGIGIKIEDEWIWRWDVGTESMTEKTKGQASDAYKRSGFNFGIGRELYDYPRIFLQLKGASHVTGNDKPEFTVKAGNNNKKIGTSGWGLKLKEWTWTITFDDNNKPKELIGKDEKGVVRFDSKKTFNGLPKGNAKPETPKPQTQKTAPKTKPKMNKDQYDKAMLSKDVEALEKALKAFDLTEDQLGNLSLRIEEIKQ